MKVNELTNMRIYFTSFFRDDKEQNYHYFEPDSSNLNEEIVIEMCNTTEIYFEPIDPSSDHNIEISFWVFQAQEYEYGSKYNIISILISGVGGFILIVLVVIYLDGFTVLYQTFKERQAEAKL